MNRSFWIVLGLIILLLVVVGTIEVEENRKTTEACTDVGGTYMVIGEEFSPVLKHDVDIYGCVK